MAEVKFLQLSPGWQKKHLKMHQIDALKYGILKCFLWGSMPPDPPRGVISFSPFSPLTRFHAWSILGPVSVTWAFCLGPLCVFFFYRDCRNPSCLLCCVVNQPSFNSVEWCVLALVRLISQDAALSSPWLGLGQSKGPLPPTTTTKQIWFALGDSDVSSDWVTEKASLVVLRTQSLAVAKSAGRITWNGKKCQKYNTLVSVTLSNFSGVRKNLRWFTCV